MSNDKKVNWGRVVPHVLISIVGWMVLFFSFPMLFFGIFISPLIPVIAALACAAGMVCGIMNTAVLIIGALRGDFELSWCPRCETWEPKEHDCFKQG